MFVTANIDNSWVIATLTITITGTNSRLGDRAFAAAGPRLWNSLPIHNVRRLDLSLDTFRRKTGNIQLFEAPALSDCCF